MRVLAYSLVLCICLTACKEKSASPIDYSEKELNVTTSIYPENITKVFDAHGGIDVWNTFESLSFTIPRTDGNEVTTTALKSRSSIVDLPKHKIGFDGETVWLVNKDTTAYKGNPRFYYNLMFYFYAMPFVLGDDGIMYENVPALNFEEKAYPGIKISYHNGVGESPEDEYILYYDPDTYKMAWLGYTVTYFSKEKSKDFHYIRYKDWTTLKGLELPLKLQWYAFENGEIGVLKNEVTFINLELEKTLIDDSVFEMPESAKRIE